MPFCAENTVMIIAVVASGILLWLFCAFSTAATARNHGGDYNVWLLVGFLGGPVSMLIAHLYYRHSGERYRIARHSDGGRYNLPEIMQCPKCNQSVPSSFETCQFCGAPLHRKGRR
jgi:hypothetical protein